MTIKRVAVSTGGGDCPGLNAVIRGLVKTGVREFDWEFLGIEDGLGGLIDPNKLTNLTLAAVRGILPRGGTILGTTNRANPFKYPVEVDGKWVERDISDQLVARIRQLRIDCLVMIGGDGTMAIADGLAKKGVRVVGVPKTIDNDLAATDYTFGFDTACSIAMEALDRLHTTAESHDRVMLLEVMGRYAGHIALHAGLAGGADVILVPEVPYLPERVLEKIQARRRAGTAFSIVIIAEGARPEGGSHQHVEEPKAGQALRLVGAAGRLAVELLALDPEIELRTTVLGHVQRGGSPSHFDRVLGTRFGCAAAHLIQSGGFNRMVCVRGLDIKDVPISEAVETLRLVNTERVNGLVHAARSLGISFGD
jgi:6-phosphofructokinase 1